MATPTVRSIREAAALASAEIDASPGEPVPILDSATVDPETGNVRIRWEVSEGTDVHVIEAEVSASSRVYILEVVRRKDLEGATESVARAIASLIPSLPGRPSPGPPRAPLDYGVLDAMERIGRSTNLPRLLEEEIKARDEDLAG